jgi:hypothetical protein
MIPSLSFGRDNRELRKMGHELPRAFSGHLKSVYLELLCEIQVIFDTRLD